MDATIKLRQYLDKGKTFVVPDYQRGYIWGKRRVNSNDIDSVSYILDTLLTKYKYDERVFLQGVTVTEETDTIVLIDGQQRTTFFYILLKILGYQSRMAIRYDIRDKSQEFLEVFQPDDDFTDDPAGEEYQDIYFFKKTIRLINEALAKHSIVDRKALLDYLLDHVCFLYINIPAHQAKKVFTMMNGNRAKMLDAEIIKAELLRLVSLPTSEPDKANDVELSALRSRYAREWDRWIHWWNLEEVRRMYKTDSNLGWLLMSVMPAAYDSVEKVTLDSFRREVIGRFSTAKAAKDTFYKLRQTQKRFEDTFHNPKRHNMVGAILRVSRDQSKFIKYYFVGPQKDDDTLRRYYLCSFVGMSHEQIVNTDEFAQAFVKSYNRVLNALKDPYVFDDKDGKKEVAYRTLLRLNIDEDNLQNQDGGRRFDFSIWDGRNRSLEHIFPKSQVVRYDKERGVYLDMHGEIVDRADYGLERESIGEIDDSFPTIGEEVSTGGTLMATEHCIGNLVLLYNDDNATFNANDFQRKKEIFLVGEDNGGRREMFKSRHLLHTVYHFSESEWGAREIRKYFKMTLQQFCDSYRDIIEGVKDNIQYAE